MDSVQSVDDTIAEILGRFDTITVVGASAAEQKASYYVPEHMRRNGWRIVPVNPARPTIFGTQAVASLAEVDEPVGLVEVFRPSEQCADIVRQAVAVGAKAVWLQLGITSDEGRRIAVDNGLLYVEDRCLLVEQRRLNVHAPRA